MLMRCSIDNTSVQESASPRAAAQPSSARPCTKKGLMAKPRYKLTKMEGDGKATCCFFNMPQGCRNGDKCAFLHVQEAAVPSTPSTAQAGPASGKEETHRQKRRRSQVEEEILEAAPTAAPKVKREKKRKTVEVDREKDKEGRHEEALEVVMASHVNGVEHAVDRVQGGTERVQAENAAAGSVQQVQQSGGVDGKRKRPRRRSKGVEQNGALAQQQLPQQQHQQAQLRSQPHQQQQQGGASSAIVFKPYGQPQANGQSPKPHNARAARITKAPQQQQQQQQQQKPKAPRATQRQSSGTTTGATNNPFLSASPAATLTPTPEPVEQVATADGVITLRGVPKFHAPAPPAVAQADVIVPLPVAAPDTTRVDATALKTKLRSSSTIGEATSRVSASLAGLPVSPFQPGKPAVEADQEDEVEEEDEEASDESADDEQTAPAAPLLNLPAGPKWVTCVLRTRSHPKYEGMFDSEVTDRNWVKTNKHGAWCKDLPHVLAVDCEMCATRDPVSNVQNGKALIRLSLVSGENEETLIDTLVLPSLPVVDYRTDIHGIGAADLEPVRFTFRHAQAAMLQLCCDQTVLVGHSLYNDLTALQLQHDVVADTSMLFQREDRPTDTVALKDLASALLGETMPDPHDSVVDARVTLRVMKKYMEQDTVAPIPRLPGSKRRKSEINCLLVHRIPGHVTAQHLREMFATMTHVTPADVEPVNVHTSNRGRAMVRFFSQAHAELAFKVLKGPARQDTAGRPQKKVFLAGSKDYVQVCMVGGGPAQA